LRIIKKGDAEIEGVTDGDRPRRRGPKRASYIRKVFALRKKDDVRKYIVKREVKKGDKTLYKSPRIQRLITEKRIRRKKLAKKGKLEAYKRGKDERQKYEKVLAKYIKDRKAAHHHADAAKVEAPAPAAPAKQTAAPAKQAAAPTKQAAAPAKQAPAAQTSKQAPAKQQQKK
jgi:small subunit ribosomal protein S6e